MALVTKVNTGFASLNFNLGLKRRVCTWLSVTVHSLRVRGRGGLSGTVLLQAVPQMIGNMGTIFNFF